jgi:hypothetical protein
MVVSLNHQNDMTSNESKAKANLIWDKLFSIKNEDKSKDVQISMIESVIIEIAQEQRKVGRSEILNYMQDEVNRLRD